MNKTIKQNVTNSLVVNVIPNASHQFVMTTEEVAIGYGVTEANIRKHKKLNPDDFVEGKHFVKGVTISTTPLKNAQPNQTYWTKKGIVRFGFFIKSPSAKLFRDWAEDLIFEKLEATSPAPPKATLTSQQQRVQQHYHLIDAIRQNLVRGDLADVAKKNCFSRDATQNVMRGESKNVSIIKALFERAKSNRQTLAHNVQDMINQLTA